MSLADIGRARPFSTVTGGLAEGARDLFKTQLAIDEQAKLDRSREIQDRLNTLKAQEAEQAVAYRKDPYNVKLSPLLSTYEAGSPEYQKLYSSLSAASGADQMGNTTKGDYERGIHVLSVETPLIKELMSARLTQIQDQYGALTEQLGKAKLEGDEDKIKKISATRDALGMKIIAGSGNLGTYLAAVAKKDEEHAYKKGQYVDLPGPSGEKGKAQVVDIQNGMPVFGPWMKEKGSESTSLEANWLANWRKTNPTATPAQENAAIEKHQRDTASLRGESFALTRGTAMLDTKAGNAPVMMNWKEINDANKKEPGRYIPAGPSTPALTRTALMEDIRGNITNAKASLSNLKTDFTAGQRAQIAYVMKSGDPKSAMSSFLQGSAGATMTPDQIDYVTDLAQLVENAMAMRSVLGAGQGSDELRAAIRATIPGGATPSKQYGLVQLNKFEQVLNRLQRGIPKVPLAGAKGETQTNSTTLVPLGLPSGTVDNGDGTFTLPNGKRVRPK